MSKVNHPSHYATDSGVEVIEITRHLSNNLGNAVKYMLRAGKKDTVAEDLAKAAWYLVDNHEMVNRDLGGIEIEKEEVRWACVRVAVSLPDSPSCDPARYLLFRMATGYLDTSDLLATAFLIHYRMGLQGKDLPHGYTMARLTNALRMHASRFWGFIHPDEIEAHEERVTK